MSAPAATPRTRSRGLLWIAGAALFALALALRFDAAHRELPYLYDWDEPGFSDLAFRMAETGDLNPHRFNYPTLPTYGYALADAVFRAAGGREGSTEPGTDAWNVSARDEWNVPQTRLALLHRQVTALIGATTCVLTFLLAVRLGFTWAAAGAGLLVALAPYLVESSSHAAVGPWTALFALASLIPMARPEPTRRALIASAVAAGLAAASKYNAVLVLVPALWCARPRGGRGGGDVLRVAGAALATFALSSPFVFLDPRTAAHDIGYELVHYAVRGHGAFGEGRGAGNLFFYLRYIANVVGPLAWLAIPGALALAARDAGTRRVALFPAIYLAFMSLQRVAFGRNMEPVFPLAAVFALGALEGVARAVPVPARRASAAACVLAALAGLLAVGRGLPPAQERWRAEDSRSQVMRSAAALRPGQPGAVVGGLHVHGEDLARTGGAWVVADVESTLALAARGRVGWVVLPAAADSVASAALGASFDAKARLGSQPVPESGPPRQPALTLWVRSGPG